MTATLDTGAAAASDGAARAPIRARVSWMLFDWAAQPYYTLVQTFLFAPYFANAVVENAACGSMIAEGSEKAACGQALWGYAAAVAGLLIAIVSPLLGAVADGRGARKPWIAGLSVVFLAGLTTLWTATPAADVATIGVVLLGFIAATLAAELMGVFSNSIMTGLVPKDELGRLSGNGWAVGYFGGLASLALVIGFLAPLPGSTTTLLGLDPIFELDQASRASDRMTGPIAALWFLIFIIPFFLFVPDRKIEQAAADGERSAGAELWTP